MDAAGKLYVVEQLKKRVVMNDPNGADILIALCLGLHLSPGNGVKGISTPNPTK